MFTSGQIYWDNYDRLKKHVSITNYHLKSFMNRHALQSIHTKHPILSGGDYRFASSRLRSD